MSSPPRNACLARGTAPAGTNTILFQVPAGFVCLLKDVVLYRVTGTTTNFQLYLQGQDPFGQAPIAVGELATTAVDTWVGWIALNATDVVVLYTDAGDVMYWLSGALLPYAPGLAGVEVTLPQAGVDAGVNTVPPTPVPLPPPLVQA